MSLRAKRSNLNLQGIAVHPSDARNDDRAEIFVSGSIARDTIMDFPGRFAEHIDPSKIHILNVSFGINRLEVNIGGTAANICYNLALLGEKPRILGGLGREEVGIRNYLAERGVDTRYIVISKKLSTATAYIITDRDDNQITGFYAGAMNEPMELPRVKKGDWGIIAAENPRNMIKLAKHYASKGVNYIFDPGQQITALTKTELETGIKGARVLIGNDYEIGVITRRLSLRGSATGGDEAIPWAVRLLLRPPRRTDRNDIVIVRTLGPKGSEITAGNRRIKIGIAKPRRVLDPTGAGDAYRAGFLKGLVLGYNLRRCGELGAAVASFAVEKYGTQNHRFKWGGVVIRRKRNF